MGPGQRDTWLLLFPSSTHAISQSIVEYAVPKITPTIDPVVTGDVDLVETLYRYAPVGFALYDRSFTLRRFNPTWASFIARYTRSDPSRIVVGANLFDLAPGTEAETVPLFDRVLAGEVVRQDGLRLESEGIVSYWDTVLMPVVSDGSSEKVVEGEEGEEVVGVMEVTVDATHRVLAYESLEQRVAERTRELERRKEVAESLGDILTHLTQPSGQGEAGGRHQRPPAWLAGRCCSLEQSGSDDGTPSTIRA